MKLTGYREQHCLEGVSVLTLSDVEVPIAEVLENRLGDVTPTPEQTATAHARPGADPGAPPQRFRYRVGQGAQRKIAEAEGLILGHGDASLVSFLEHRYLPDEASGRTVDRLLGQLGRQEISRADFIHGLEEEVLGDDRERSRARLIFEPDTSTSPPFVGHHRDLHHFFEERRDGLGGAFLRSISPDLPMAIASPFCEERTTGPVPRWRFALTGDDDAGVGCWDGHRYRVFERLDEIPETLLRSLERDGQVVLRPGDWFVPLPDLRPRFLVRVPHPSEVAHLVEPGPPPRWEDLGQPSYLVDTRRPMTLGRGHLRRLDDPELATAVLARCTARGAYLPGMPPAPIEDIALSPEGQPATVLAGCWPR